MNVFTNDNLKGKGALSKLSEAEITKLFKPIPDQPDRIYGREGKSIEYKQSYNHGSMAQYFKTMASFANADGGYIIFGIGDSPREFLGLKENSKIKFDSLKIEEFTNNLNKYFQPEILWEHTLFKFRGKDFGIIYTYALENKPCICTKDDERSALKEGDIYYRYRARSERIKYSELNQIFVDREKKQTQLWMDLIQKTGKIGVENAALLDLNNGFLSSQYPKIVVDKNIIDKLKFIKEGHFVEKGEAPTLKLMGDIKGISSAETILVSSSAPRIKTIAIEPEDITRSFLNNEDIESPFEYIKVALNCSSGFQPIYYYLDKANIGTDGLVSYITEEKRQSQTVSIIKERLEGRRESYEALVDTGSNAYKGKSKYLDLWLKFEIHKVDFEELEDLEISWLLNSFYSIRDQFLVDNAYKFKNELLRIFDGFFSKSSGNIAGNFRKVVCRLDEVIYYMQMAPQIGQQGHINGPRNAIMQDQKSRIKYHF